MFIVNPVHLIFFMCMYSMCMYINTFATTCSFSVDAQLFFTVLVLTVWNNSEAESNLNAGLQRVGESMSSAGQIE